MSRRRLRPERWARGGIGTVNPAGLLTASGLAELYGRIDGWARAHHAQAVVLTLGWRVVLTASGADELEAALRCTLPVALVVPPERLGWAHKHVRQLAVRAPLVLRDAFSDRGEALSWALRVPAAVALFAGMSHRLDDVPERVNRAGKASG